jgi:hypothetical protein
MTANINENELKLLAYLHEHARGYGKDFKVDIGEATKAAGFDLLQFGRHASYLAEHGLVGISVMDVERFSEDDIIYEGLWLTGQGEDFMRELESQPGVPKKLTVSAISEGWGAIKSIAASLLAEYTKHKLGI